MVAIHRRVFGEPQPAGSKLAGLIARAASNQAYCNRTGTLGHDRVTDLPYAIPALGLNLVHPTPLLFVNAQPPDEDSYGIFRWHHMPLYLAGLRSANAETATIECARLCAEIYNDASAEPWTAKFDQAGVVWAAKADGRRLYVVFRGSKSFLDWIRDATAIDLKRIFHHDIFGLTWDGFTLGMDVVWAAIAPYLVDFDEVYFTGHSLGAARADMMVGRACAS